MMVLDFLKDLIGWPRPAAPSDEPRPPWIVRRSVFPGDDPHWHTEQGRTWLRNVFLPFYDSLSNAEQIAYCGRWKAPQPWVSLFLHPDLDEIAAEADRETPGVAAAPLNFRRHFLGE
jgi:hypothetical protein